MIHDKFEIRKWSKLFPLSDLRAKARSFVLARQKEDPTNYENEAAVRKHIALMEPCGEQVTSPFHIAVVEQIRSEALGSDLPENKLATDVFIFSEGEAPRRDITKVGGLPYLPAKAKWPKKDGKPLTFIAQFSFLDSKDIVDELPGDILLIFGSSEAVDHMNEDLLQFEWVKVGNAELISSTDVPPPDFAVPPCYGSIFRTFDFTRAYNAFSKYHRPWLLDIIEGTKIGGAPRWIQREKEMDGRFLCALGSIFPEKFKPYPFLNRPNPYPRPDFTRRGLVWGDCGSLYVFMNKKKHVQCTIQCY